MRPRARLIVIRGNSGSGKTSVAREVRRRYGRGCALIEQDHLRRIVLREHDGPGPGGVAPRLIEAAVQVALEGGYHVVLDGILGTGRYGEMLRTLLDAWHGHAYYLDVTLDETLRRHASRPQAAEFGPELLRDWYAPADLLRVAGERVVPESSTREQTVELILRTSGLDSAPAVAPCPAECPRCPVTAD